MRLEARAKAKEIHDTHIGCLKIFAGMNKISIELDQKDSNFNYKNFIGSTRYVSTNGMSLDNPIAITDLAFVSDIREEGVFESLNITIKLDPNRPQTDEIALNHLLWMNGIESVFRDLLDDNAPKRRIQAVADILVFYHEFLGKNRQMEGNSYNIELNNHKVSLVVTYTNSYLFDVHLTRSMDYSELKDFIHEEEDEEQVEEQPRGFFAKFKKPKFGHNKLPQREPAEVIEMTAPVKEEKITEVVKTPDVSKSLKTKSLFGKKKNDFEDLEEAIKDSDISIEADEKVDPITKALQLKMEREKLGNTGVIPRVTEQIANVQPIVEHVNPIPVQEVQKEVESKVGTALRIEDVKTHLNEAKQNKEKVIMIEQDPIDAEIASIVETTIKEDVKRVDNHKYSLESISKSIDEQVKAARAYRAQSEQQTAPMHMSQVDQQSVPTDRTIDLTGIRAEMEEIDDIVDDSALEDCFI